ncbi:unnamed protein product [Ixodes pacificus]
MSSRGDCAAAVRWKTFFFLTRTFLLRARTQCLDCFCRKENETWWRPGVLVLTGTLRVNATYSRCKQKPRKRLEHGIRANTASPIAQRSRVSVASLKHPKNI